jgi:protein TonB
MEPKKNSKADLSRWSGVFLLAGLALMLIISYAALEWKTNDESNLADIGLSLNDDLEEEIPVTNTVTPPPPPPPPPPAPEVIEVVEDEEEVEETIIESTETNQNEEIVEIEEIEEVEEEEIADVPFAVIENVPIYPGCENAGNNEAKKKCMSEQVMKFVQKKFDNELANDLGLDAGRQRISVQFKIDRSGNVVNVRARAPHPRLEQEAIKVVQQLPKMTPGKQRGKAVGVLYALPIVFQVEN